MFNYCINTTCYNEAYRYLVIFKYLRILYIIRQKSLILKNLANVSKIAILRMLNIKTSHKT